MEVSTAFLYSLVGFAALVLGVAAALHALLNKRDPYAAMVWGAVCLSFPIGGPLIYLLLGINRIHRRAARLVRRSNRKYGTGPLSSLREERQCSIGSYQLEEGMRCAEVTQESLPQQIRVLANIGHAVTGRPLIAGNRIELYYNGEQAYPPMLEAIESAKSSVWIDTYIFNYDTIGKKFVDALSRARARGVDVRVQVDGFGSFFSRPRVDKVLKENGVSVSRFLPPRLWPPQFFINLRNHRKLMIVDGKTAFTGGMNICDMHVLKKPKRSGFCGFLDRYRCTCCQDAHFRIEGPVLENFLRIFAREWLFSAQEELDIPPVDDTLVGGALCRTILDGPDDYFERFHSILLGIISAARESVHIMTPYFLPQRELVMALRTAAMRGVDVAVILPRETDEPLVNWALGNVLRELIGQGVRIYFQPAPFAHTKFFVVDRVYAHIGSANLDPRSLRLNFELTVECFDLALATELGEHFDTTRAQSKEYTLEDLANRNLLVRIRDALCWLISPYL